MPTKRKKIGRPRLADADRGLVSWVKDGTVLDDETFLRWVPAPLRTSEAHLRELWETAGRPIEWRAFWRREKGRCHAGS